MVEINAFVAHSFSIDDKELIGIFVEHFDSLASSLPGFRWDHAQPAEPVSVSGKVLTKIEGKNVFIGICTRNEYVVSPKTVFRIPFVKLIGLNEIRWKTSDWIIQEIGLAVGRGMMVIIFLEDGVRKPGGLFGDIEYISFSRRNPHASLDKLLQMLGTFMPKTVVTSTADAKSSTSDKAKETEEPDKNLAPQPDWDQAGYDRAAAHAIVLKRDAGVFDAIDAAYKASPFSKGIALTIWEARIEFLRMLGDQKSDFEKIKKAARDNPANSQLLFFMASGYREFSDHQTAARTFEDAATNAEKDSDRLRYLTMAAGQYAQAGQRNRSKEIVETLKCEVAGKPEQQYKLLLELRDLAEAEKNDELQLAIMEQMVHLRPGDSSARFSLAFKHSEISNPDMAIHHYLKIPVVERNAITWNNLGVAYGDLGMPIKAVAAFRVSENGNEALAMCNLGFRLLDSGFLPEAQQEADRALSIKAHHKNVPGLLTRLTELKDEEDGRLTEKLEETKVNAAFYRKLGEGVLKLTPYNIAPNWSSPEGALEAKMDGASVRIFGIHERPTLGGLLSNPFSGPIDQAMVTHHIEYSGRVRGNIIAGDVRRSRDGEVPSLLGSTSDNVKVLMVFDDDHTELFVMEKSVGSNPKFYSRQR